MACCGRSTSRSGTARAGSSSAGSVAYKPQTSGREQVAAQTKVVKSPKVGKFGLEINRTEV